MSHTVSLTKIVYDPDRLKTPNIKDIASSSTEQSKDVTPNPAIIMDEFGQTPDHFYLARKPPTFYQVKRKLDLQGYETSGDILSTKRRRKVEIVTAKPKGCLLSGNVRNVRKKSGNWQMCQESQEKGRKNAKTVVEKPRYDTSLGQLTKKFLKLLSDASDGVINLNTACTLLSVPKRRLYDITNVLEGAGLIQKTSRNNIQWMGRGSSACPSVLKYDLEKEIDILEAKENKLDELIYHMKSEINSLKETEGMYHYITSDDLKSIEEFGKEMVVGVKIAPTGQVIEAFEKKVVLTSKSSEIEAFLLSDDVSFTNILHPHAEYKENAYNVQINNNKLSGALKEDPFAKDHSSLLDDPCYELQSPYRSICNSSYSRMFAGSPMFAGSTWTEGDMVIKNAFITEEDDIAPMGRNFLLQTEDQDLDILPFTDFDHPPMDSYSFSLDDGEGLTDLFDCNFHYP